MNHLGDTNKMVSDTPISDSTPHNVAELGMLCRRLERLASVRLDYIEQFEAEIDRLSAKVAQLYEGSEEQKQRIKRLEEAGDAMANAYEEICHDSYDQKQIANWRIAKEDKL